MTPYENPWKCSPEQAGVFVCCGLKCFSLPHLFCFFFATKSHVQFTYCIASRPVFNFDFGISYNWSFVRDKSFFKKTTTE